MSTADQARAWREANPVAYHVAKQREIAARGDRYRATEAARQRNANDASRLGAHAHRRPWTAEQDAIVLDDSHTIAEAAALLGRTRAAVACRRYALVNAAQLQGS